MAKNKMLIVQNINITISLVNQEDYMSLTDMVANQEDGSKLIEKWLSNKNTLELLTIWEQLNNPNFNSPEIGGILAEAGTNRFYMSVKRWVKITNSIGIVAKTGRYGGTFAHKDLAFNFGLYISPMFNLLLIKEYQRLKEIENNQYGLEWDVKRILSKANYYIHTDAIKNYMIPKLKYSQIKEGIVYANEADVLNIALFGYTAAQWREANPQKVLAGENIRDMASINELAILSNIENINSMLIKDGKSKQERLRILRDKVIEQKQILDKVDFLKSIKKESGTIYMDAQTQPQSSSFDKTKKEALDYELSKGKE
ncbi:hypothetical protein EZS27_013431 [termite gut metagenome]|uniref:KilA-N domain-containing protein n=1 Tax=termite gut metagenome TaxID=433724 RepID=A0A5J4RXT0_9ZZZZ